MKNKKWIPVALIAVVLLSFVCCYLFILSQGNVPKRNYKNKTVIDEIREANSLLPTDNLSGDITALPEVSDDSSDTVTIPTDDENEPEPDNTGDVKLSPNTTGIYFINNDEFLNAVPEDLVPIVTANFAIEVCGNPPIFMFDSFDGEVVYAHSDDMNLRLVSYEGVYGAEITMR